MICYKILKSNINMSQQDSNINVSYLNNESMHNMNRLKDRLNTVKSKLDCIYETNYNKACKIMRYFDPFIYVKHNISDKINATNVTNAWLKGYEILSKFNLIPEKCDKFVYFDNAALPGSFVLATHHLVHTKCDIKDFKWLASSLLPSSTNTSLKDVFKLYKNYKDNWLIDADDNNNGDITKWNNIIDINSKLTKKLDGDHLIDLYSCDIGIDIGINYNDQEMIHQHLNISQIVCGIMNLKGGGSMFIKHYTIFEPYTISYISLLIELFDTVYIVKPISSRRTNSEVYIVCKKYKYPFDINNQLIYDKLISETICYTGIPLVSVDKISKTLDSLYNASLDIFIRQIESLNLFIDLYNYGNPGKIHNIMNYNKKLVKKYMSLNLLFINDVDKLNIVNGYK